MFIPLMGWSQFPITEEFDPGTSWTYTNGAGMQNYVGVENYATFNVNTTPYPNSSTVTITSPVYDMSSCLSAELNITFSLVGEIESGYDFAYFDYWNGSAWVTTHTYTGVQNVIEVFTVPATATQFRFRLATDGSVNTFTSGPWWNQTTSPYYYDIPSITIDCATVLPVELLEFDATCNSIKWVTASEINTDYFVVESSTDGDNWYDTGIKIPAQGNSSTETLYETELISSNYLQYYRLLQVDMDGESELFLPIKVVCPNKARPDIVGIYNLLGQRVGTNLDALAEGIYIVHYQGGGVDKIHIRKQ
mgnify:CR=1 FL=1